MLFPPNIKSPVSTSVANRAVQSNSNASSSSLVRLLELPFELRFYCFTKLACVKEVPF